MSEIGSWHSECFACGSDNDRGLRLVCRPTGDGRVAGEFRARPWMQGYPGRLQGGIIAALLDSAMTQCVHAHGVDAVTGSLRLRFTRPALLDATFTVSAWVRSRRHGAWIARAELCAAGVRIAWADGVFVAMPAAAPGCAAV